MTPRDSVAPGRSLALETLQAVDDGAYLDRAFNAVTAGAEDRDRRWARECAYGVLRYRGRLDHLLGARVRRGLDGLDPPVLDLLRMGAHQILHMDGVPDYAAVSQTVDQTRGHAGRGAAGLANAVLRGLARDGLDREAFPDPSREPLEYLASWHSHPSWLVRRWLSRWSMEDVEALLVANNAVPPTYLHPLGVTLDRALDALGPGAAEAGRGSGCIRLATGASPAEALDMVRGVIQDPAAALVTHYADVAPGSTVADLCAAPGGKAFALAESAGYVVAADRSPARLARVQDALERLGGPVGLVVADAERPPLTVARAVLIDVPCSGTGTLRRRPDLKWRLRPGDIESLVQLQGRILEGAADVVSPGGLLVYSTCTLEPEENENQVAAFLERHDDFFIEPTAAVDTDLLGPSGGLVVLPHRTGFDGAYAARLRRAA